MEEKFKLLIVEDDEANIKLHKILLQKYCHNITIVGVAKNSTEFTDMFLRLHPEILLLDINLEEDKNALDVLSKLGEINCQIIVTSSHQEYALKAINQYHITSYILKPVNSTSLTKAILAAEENILQQRALENYENNKPYTKNLIGIPRGTFIDLIDIRDILYLEADGKYTVFYLTKNILKIVSKNIGFYEKILPSHLFFRIHYKYIVNLKKVTTISRTDGNYCLLNNGISLSIAKRRREELRKLLYAK